MKRNPLGALVRFFASVVLGGAMILAARSVALAQSCAADRRRCRSSARAAPPSIRSAHRPVICSGSAARPGCSLTWAAAPICASASRARRRAISALVAISHLHPDHVSDLPAFLWLSHTVRTEPLPIVGPSAGKGAAGPAGNDVAPDFQTFLSRLFDEKSGAFQVLGGTLGGKGNGVRLNVSTVDVLKTEPTKVFEGAGLESDRARDSAREHADARLSSRDAGRVRGVQLRPERHRSEIRRLCARC